jgi:hypothetical protein
VPGRAPAERPAFLARLRAPTWILAAGGVALAGAAGLFALRAQSGQEDLDALHCERDIEPCLAARDDAEPWFLARDVTLAATGVALGVAVVLAIVDVGAGADADAERGGVAIVPVVSPSIAALSARGRF